MIIDYLKPLGAVLAIAVLAWAIGAAAIVLFRIYPTACEYTLPQE